MLPHPTASDVISGCASRYAAARGKKVSDEPWRSVLRCRIAESNKFNIVKGAFVLSDDNFGISSFIDAIVEYGGSKAVVKFNLGCDTQASVAAEMAVAMFLTGIWDGFSVTVDDSGVIRDVLMCSPSNKEAREILDGIMKISASMAMESFSGVIPPAVTE